MTANREFLESETRRTLISLASPRPEALSRVPAGTCRPDELALEFDDVVHAFVGNSGEEVSDLARVALARVDSLLDAMSREPSADLWTNQAVCDHPRWSEVRQPARDALRALGWDAV